MTRNGTNPNFRPVIITLAPVDYRDLRRFPSAEQLAEDVICSAAAGASVAHYHVTDPEGRPTCDTTFFKGVAGLVRERCDIILQGSTGGVGSTVAERSVSLEVVDLEMASLNMGSCNLFGKIYANPPEDVLTWAEAMRRRSLVPDMCFFEPGFFPMFDWLRTKGLAAAPSVASLCLGFPGALPADVENLVFMRSKLPPGAEWTLVHHGSQDFGLLAAAIASGGNIRVGFEDSDCLSPGERATRNSQLVEKARALIHQLGRTVATPEETRRRYGIPSRFRAERNREPHTTFPPTQMSDSTSRCPH